MSRPKFISTNFAALLVYGRPPMVFAGMFCAISVMLDRNPFVYYSGVIFLLTAMILDLIDGWFAARFRPQAKLAHLADRIMDKVVYATVFPMVAVGMMWRYQYLAENANFHLEMLHVVFVLVLCVTVLMRDNCLGDILNKSPSIGFPGSILFLMPSKPAIRIAVNAK